MTAKFKHPFTCVIAGPTGSGKTMFIERFLQNLPVLMTHVPKKVIYCYGEWQNSYERLTQYSGDISFVEGLPDLDGLQSGEPRLIILDDLMGETDERVTRLFVKGSHHKNISIMYIVQNLFNKNKEQRCINLNTHYIVLFKNPRDNSQIIHLGKQMYPKNTHVIQDAYKLATEKPYSYLLIDLKQDTPDHIRLRSDIFNTHQTVYQPRK